MVREISYQAMVSLFPEIRVEYSPGAYCTLSPILRKNGRGAEQLLNNIVDTIGSERIGLTDLIIAARAWGREILDLSVSSFDPIETTDQGETTESDGKPWSKLPTPVLLYLVEQALVVNADFFGLPLSRLKGTAIAPVISLLEQTLGSQTPIAE